MRTNAKLSCERHHLTRHPQVHSGGSLIVVMMILIVVSLLGVGGAQIALMSERGARNDRDQQVAWQSAEAGLHEAELEMIDAKAKRQSLFDGKTALPFLPGCGTSGQSIGLCAIVQNSKPAWLTADFTSTESTAPTIEFGTFTKRVFAAGGIGIQPEKKPRYVIELLPDPSGDKTANSPPAYIYRVTAMGFGPRADTQVVLQMFYRN
jgi:type IV pilus assembly protein PilX